MANTVEYAPKDPVTDEQWSALGDEDQTKKLREQGEKQYDDLSMDQVKHLRLRAKSDLFFLSRGVLGYELMSPRLHGHLCSWLEATRRVQYRILLLPRGHYKSTTKTITESVQMALPNDNGIIEAWPYSLGPSIKLLLSHENKESASRFLYEIAQAFLQNPLLMALFPECVPSKIAGQRINKWELELPRPTWSKEPTFDTIGAGGAAQGRHYHHIVMDDIIGEAARDSATVMKTTLQWFDNVNSLLTRIKMDGWDLVGTRWSWKDIYSHAMDVYGVDKSRSVIRCMEDRDVPEGVACAYLRGNIESGVPIFPEEFDMEFFTRMRKNPKVYAAQYANNPKESGLTEFDPRWLKFYNTNGVFIFIFNENGPPEKIAISSLDRVILADPSMGETDKSDESGLIVAGMDYKRRIFLLETIKERLVAPELINLLFKLYARWRPRLISIEEVVFSGLLQYWFLDKAKERGIHPTIHRYRPGSSKSKLARVRGLQPYFSSGQIYIQEGMHQFRDEYEWFGVTSSDHLLDALAQGPEIWTPGETEKINADNFAAEQQIMNERSALTGY